MSGRALDAAAGAASLAGMRVAREIHEARRYRFTAALPLVVSFRSVVYRLEFRRVTGAPVWHVHADDLAGGVGWEIVRGGESELMAQVAMYFEGFDLMHPTGPSAIMERLCREGRAQALPAGIQHRWWAFWGEALAR